MSIELVSTELVTLRPGNIGELCIRDLAEAIGGKSRLGSLPPLGGDLEAIARVTVDSRQVQPGDLFWGLRGKRFDGSHFAEDAFARGALGAVVCGRRLEPWAGTFSIEVDDTYWALWELALYLRRRLAGDLIAVTGSTARSSTARMIDRALSSRLIGSAPANDYGNQVGIPLCLFSVTPGDDYAILEMNATGRGEIDSISHLCSPQIAVITRTAETNTGHLSDPAQVAAAHAEVLSGLPGNGWVVLDGDDPWLQASVPARRNMLRVGTSSTCDLIAHQATARDDGWRFELDHQIVNVPGRGAYDLMSALMAIGVGRILSLPTAELVAALAGPDRRTAEWGAA